ncbi:MAG: succinate dehydrogenase cytochrome b subunit [Actinomycetia bacterium]|nr:succinate dehydrogenase cytochrome b subunit [Actinomycetes bacterium]
MTPIRPAPRKTLPWPIQFYRSAVGRKWVMGVTGLMLLGFVVVHMLGNFKAYISPESIDHYGEALRDMGGHLVPRTHLLWAMRLGLIGAFALHIHAALSLTLMSRRSNPQSGIDGQKKYAGNQDYIAANFASRTMRWTGPIIVLYILFHLADLTWGTRSDEFVRGEPYHNMVDSMSSLPVAIIYIVANLAVAIHIFHGTWSAMQSIGINNPRINGIRKPVSMGLAALVLVGNLSFPIMVQAGVLDEETSEESAPALVLSEEVTS